MLFDKYDAVGAMFEGDDDVWWVTGGYDGFYVLEDTEIFDVNEERFTTGIDLPKEMHDHNLVNVNNTHMVLLGGFETTDEVFIIDRLVYETMIYTCIQIYDTIP